MDLLSRLVISLDSRAQQPPANRATGVVAKFTAPADKARITDAGITATTGSPPFTWDGAKWNQATWS